jgi:hypothetical protein
MVGEEAAVEEAAVEAMV